MVFSFVGVILAALLLVVFWLMVRRSAKGRTNIPSALEPRAPGWPIEVMPVRPTTASYGQPCHSCTRIIPAGEPFLANYLLCAECVQKAAGLFLTVAHDEPLGATVRPRGAIDFDGVLSDYSGGWGRGDAEILGKPVEGCFSQLREYQLDNELWIHSVRCRSEAGRQAIALWIEKWDREYRAEMMAAGTYVDPLHVHLCAEKPPAEWYLDDRGVRFLGPGRWPTREELRAKPWWVKPKEAA